MATGPGGWKYEVQESRERAETRPCTFWAEKPGPATALNSGQAECPGRVEIAVPRVFGLFPSPTSQKGSSSSSCTLFLCLPPKPPPKTPPRLSKPKTAYQSPNWLLAPKTLKIGFQSPKLAKNCAFPKPKIGSQTPNRFPKPVSLCFLPPV